MIQSTVLSKRRLRVFSSILVISTVLFMFYVYMYYPSLIEKRLEKFSRRLVLLLFGQSPNSFYWWTQFVSDEKDIFAKYR